MNDLDDIFDKAVATPSDYVLPEDREEFKKDVRALINSIIGEDEEFDTTSTRNLTKFRAQTTNNTRINIRNHFRHELRGKVAEL
jgi:hypothetical protein